MNLLIISSISQSLINFRGDLIADFIANRYTVHCASPEFQADHREQLEAMGAICHSIPLSRKGLNPLKDLESIRFLKRLMQDNHIDLVFPYTIKPVIYGSIAAGQSGVPAISLITGLGFTFSKSTFKSRILQKVTERLYRFALRKNRAVIFQNRDDLELFRQKRIVGKKQVCHVVNGSGINLERFKYREPRPSKDAPVSFVMIARLIPEKGVELYLQACQYIKEKYPNTQFTLIGYVPEFKGAEALQAKIDRLHHSGSLNFVGPTRNIYPYLKEHDVFVLPTYYREGVPRSILEALSVGLPIVTTNEPGCRETVTSGENGFLIPSRDLGALKNAMTHFAENPEDVIRMGNASYALATGKFDVKIINRQTLEILKKGLNEVTA
ncbi:glycosyltransferase family 4 protein [Robiginitalea sediminis]|uniref:glycosyltransferase family 4 protein n=1 Tax=Robiginitalea sediminis TaxID=1982593 RepID=UPI000B4B853A|nr:glycosyltransferase family 4 protein [Robiginitalea sediminis]